MDVYGLSSLFLNMKITNFINDCWYVVHFRANTKIIIIKGKIFLLKMIFYAAKNVHFTQFLN